MVDFPATPSLGQIFTSGDKSWVFNGTAWDARNAISTGTATDITGLLKGDGSSISAAVAGTDYLVTTDALRTSLIVGD